MDAKHTLLVLSGKKTRHLTPSETDHPYQAGQKLAVGKYALLHLVEVRTIAITEVDNALASKAGFPSAEDFLADWHARTKATHAIVLRWKASEVEWLI